MPAPAEVFLFGQRPFVVFEGDRVHGWFGSIVFPAILEEGANGVVDLGFLGVPFPASVGVQAQIRSRINLVHEFVPAAILAVLVAPVIEGTEVGTDEANLSAHEATKLSSPGKKGFAVDEAEVSEKRNTFGLLGPTWIRR